MMLLNHAYVWGNDRYNQNYGHKIFVINLNITFSHYIYMPYKRRLFYNIFFFLSVHLQFHLTSTPKWRLWCLPQLFKWSVLLRLMRYVIRYINFCKYIHFYPKLNAFFYWEVSTKYNVIYRDIILIYTLV